MYPQNSDLIESLVRVWLKYFKRVPWFTSIATGLLVIASLSAGLYIRQADKKRSEAIRLQNFNYQTQIGRLDQTEKNIKQLLDFVEIQKRDIREAEDTVNALKKEKESLTPIVETDKAIVEAIFRIQENRSRASVWRERLIGFGFGILASLAASVIWYGIQLVARGKSIEENPPA